MKLHQLALSVALLSSAHVLSACSSGAENGMVPAATAVSADAHAQNANLEAALPPMTVTKSPSCGCCHLWVEHMQRAGFIINVVDTDDLGPVKARVGVPYGKGSCHTAEIDGYFVEGHIPADDVMRLLKERPQAKGLVVPGMPAGSPGMEMPDGYTQPYVVELVARDGSTTPFAHH